MKKKKKRFFRMEWAPRPSNTTLLAPARRTRQADRHREVGPNQST